MRAHILALTSAFFLSYKYTDAQDSVVKAGCVEDLNKALKDLAALRVWVTEVHDDIPARDQNTYHSVRPDVSYRTYSDACF